MNDIIQIFEDFNRKFLELLRQIIVHPNTIIESLSDVDSTYIKPYRFFSYVSSSILVIVILSNRFDIVGFWSEQYFLPKYWQEYYNSRDEVMITLFPVTGFFFIIAIASLLSFLLFRVPKRPFKHHLFYILYLCGTLLIYFLVAIAIIVIVIDHLEWWNDFTDIVVYILLFVIPFIFVVRSLWYFGGTKILRPIKAILLIGLTAYSFSSFYFDLELDRIANDQLFYKNAKQQLPVIDNTAVLKTQFYRDSENSWLFPVNTQSDNNKKLFGIWNFESEKLEIHELADTLSKVKELPANDIDNLALYHFDETRFVIIHNHYENGTMNELWRLSDNESQLIVSDSVTIGPLSSMVSFGKRLLITRNNLNQPATLYEIKNDSLQQFFILNEANTNFDYLLNADDSTLITITSRTQNKDLKEISINRIKLDKKQVDRQTQLFENRLTQVPAYSEMNQLYHKVYNPWLKQSIDKKYIYAAYQIRTEKTFEVHLIKLDNELNILDKVYFNPDGNLSYFYAFDIDESGFYALGRIFTLVPPNPLNGEASHPFLTEIDLSDFSINKARFLKPWNSLYDGKNLFGGIEFQLYVPQAKMRVMEDSIEVLWMYQDAIEKIELKK